MDEKRDCKDKQHCEYVETAFLQLSFAIKVLTFLEQYPIKKDLFDININIIDEKNMVNLKANEFNAYEDMLLAAGNNISITFGAVAITLWEAIREESYIEPKNLKPSENARQQIAALIYMIRCCFAHGSAAPKWSIMANKYKTIYRIKNKLIDLTSMEDGTIFSYESIGGYETLWLLKDEAYRVELLK